VSRSRRPAYLFVVGGDEPQLQVQVVAPLLGADEVEDVVVLHAAHAEDLVLVLPRQFVLDGERDGSGCCSCRQKAALCIHELQTAKNRASPLADDGSDLKNQIYLVGEKLGRVRIIKALFCCLLPRSLASSSPHLNGEDLHGHEVVEQLGLPHAAEAPPGLHLDELQGLVTQDGGRGQRPGVLREREGRGKRKRGKSYSPFFLQVLSSSSSHWRRPGCWFRPLQSAPLSSRWRGVSLLLLSCCIYFLRVCLRLYLIVKALYGLWFWEVLHVGSSALLLLLRRFFFWQRGGRRILNKGFGFIHFQIELKTPGGCF